MRGKRVLLTIILVALSATLLTGIVYADDPTPNTTQRAHTDPYTLAQIVKPGGVYVTAKADTVCSLATIWGTTPDAIIEENGLPADGRLYWGQALRRPLPPKVVASEQSPFFLHEYGTFSKVLPETTTSQALALVKPMVLSGVCTWIALQGGSSNPDILREQRLKDLEDWTPPEHLVQDHTDTDALRRLVTWNFLTPLWRVDQKPPDHCVCTADKSKCAICWDDVRIPSATTPGKYYKGGCLILKYKKGTGPSTAIPDLQILTKTSWFDLDKSEDPFVMSPLDKCPPWAFAPNYNRRKGD